MTPVPKFSSLIRAVLLVGLGAGPALAQERPSLAQIVDAWLDSPHASREAEAFTHWDEDGEIPGRCAVCHSSTGVIDYLDGPMSVPGAIDHPVGLGTTVDCAACHSTAASDLVAVPFPSGVVIDSFGASAICAVCHQGRAATDTVAAAVADLDEDAIAGDLTFINVHYKPSASTSQGTAARGGFEYPGKTYRGPFAHVPGKSTCVECHNPHSLQVDLTTCTSCHQGAERFADIRISPMDFDGDGNSAEGIAAPIATLHARLGDAIRRYATEVVDAPVAYASASYPYFFIDGDGDGVASEAEAIYPNRYQSWTPRLLKAAYNYQLIAKETAIYTHNPHYALQLLYDSLESLSGRVAVDLSGLTRP